MTEQNQASQLPLPGITYSAEVVKANAQLEILHLFEEHDDLQIKPGPVEQWMVRRFGRDAEGRQESINGRHAERVLAARNLFSIVYAIDTGHSPADTPEDAEMAFGAVVRAYAEPVGRELRKLRIADLERRLGKTIFNPRNLENAQTLIGPRTSGYDELRKVKKQQALQNMLRGGKQSQSAENQPIITPEAIENAQPRKLYEALVGGKVRITPDGLAKSLWYANHEGGRTNVAVSDAEALLLIVSPAHYGGIAATRSRRKRTVDGQLSESDVAASVRAAIHTIDPKIEKMRNYKVATLERRQSMLQRMVDEARHPDLQRLGAQQSVRVDQAEVGTMIDEMINTVRLQRNWSPKESRAVRAAIDRNLHGGEESSARYAYSLLSMLREYNLHTQLLVQGKIYEAERQLQEHRNTETNLASRDD